MAVRSSAFGCACEAPRRRRDVGVDYRDGTSHDDSCVRSPHVYSLRSLPLPMCNVTSLGAVTRELSSPSRDGLTDRAQRRRHYRVRDRMAAGRSGLEALCGWLPGTVRPQAVCVSRSAHSGQGQRSGRVGRGPSRVGGRYSRPVMCSGPRVVHTTRFEFGSGCFQFFCPVGYSRTFYKRAPLSGIVHQIPQHGATSKRNHAKNRIKRCALSVGGQICLGLCLCLLLFSLGCLCLDCLQRCTASRLCIIVAATFCLTCSLASLLQGDRWNAKRRPHCTGHEHERRA